MWQSQEYHPDQPGCEFSAVFTTPGCLKDKYSLGWRAGEGHRYRANGEHGAFWRGQVAA